MSERERERKKERKNDRKEERKKERKKHRERESERERVCSQSLRILKTLKPDKGCQDSGPG